MKKIGLGIMAVGVVILITMLLCSCGSNPVAPPIDPPPVEPPIEMPEGAVVAYEDSTYAVLYDAENVYVYFHPWGGNSMQFYIRPNTASSEDFWDVKTQQGFDAYLTWADDPWYERWNHHWDDFNNVTVLDEVWVNEDAPHTLISFPRYALDPESDYRIEPGTYRISSIAYYDEKTFPTQIIIID